MVLLRILVASLAWLSLGSPAEASPLPDAPVAVFTYDALVYNAPGTASASERGPPAAGFADTTHDAGDRWSHGPSARPAGAMPSATYTYDHPVLPVQVARGTSMTLGRAGATAGLPSPLEPSHLAANAGRGVLRSVDDVMADGGTLLRGRSPAEVESILKDTPGWRVEGLGQGSAQGRGWMMREYTERGNPTGRMIRWHPGGGHHGPDPYWRVVGYEGDLFGIIR